jgi:hypothetical protein
VVITRERSRCIRGIILGVSGAVKLKIGRVKGKDSEDRMPNCCSYGKQHDILVSRSHSGEYRARSRDSMLEWATGFVVEEQAVGDDSHLMERDSALSCLRTAPVAERQQPASVKARW